jgi:putative membrane protein
MAEFLLVTPLANPSSAAWHVEPLLAALLSAAAVIYGLAYRTNHRARRSVPPVWQVIAYLGGLASLAVALLGPPDHFAEASFAAHMLQHLLLTLLAAPLIVLGRPVQVVLRGLPKRESRLLLRATLGRSDVRRWLGHLLHPLSIVGLSNGFLVMWHLPPLYEAAVQSQPLHDLEHASFLGSALLFWWVLVEPMPRHHRLSTSAAVLALFGTWMISDLLGATLTLASRPLYPLYAAGPKPWGLSPLDDQRLGGLIMWVGGGLLYAAVAVGFLARPYLRGAGEIQAPEAASTTGRPSAPPSS